MSVLTLTLIAAALVTFFWRACGVFFANRIQVDSPPFNLARAASYAVVGALIVKLIIYPQGALSTTDLPLRLVATAAGVIVFFVTRRSIAAGSWAGIVTFIILITLVPSL